MSPSELIISNRVLVTGKKSDNENFDLVFFEKLRHNAREAIV